MVSNLSKKMCIEHVFFNSFFFKKIGDQYHQTHLSGKFQPIWRTFDFRGFQKIKRGKHVSFFEIPASKSALTFEPFNIFDRTKALRDQYHQAHLSGKFQPFRRTSKNLDFLEKNELKKNVFYTHFFFGSY